MATTDSLDFEMQRRVILYKSGTVMPDDSLLGFNGDPNNAGTEDAGEKLIYNSPVGTLYVDDDGVMYRKTDSNNTWEAIGSGSGGSGSSGGGSSYSDSDVDSHLNIISASNGEILSWDGSDYAWVTQTSASNGGGSGGSSIATNNTQVSTDSSNNITFTNNNINTWKINASGSLIPVSGSEIGNIENKIGNTFFDNNNVWIGENNKIMEDNLSKELAVMTVDRNKLPNIIPRIDSEMTYDWYSQIATGNGVSAIAEITDKMYIDWASSKGHNLTVDDLHPPYGSTGYDESEWLVTPTKLRPLKNDIYGSPESIVENNQYSLGEYFTTVNLDLDKYNSFYINATDNTSQSKLDIVHRSRSNPAELGYSYNVLVYRESGFDGFKFRPRRYDVTDFATADKYFETKIGNTDSEYCKLTVNTTKLDLEPDYYLVLDLDYLSQDPQGTIVESSTSEGDRLYGGGGQDYNLYNFYEKWTLQELFTALSGDSISLNVEILNSGSYNYTGLGFGNDWTISDKQLVSPSNISNYSASIYGHENETIYVGSDSSYPYFIDNNGITIITMYGSIYNGNINATELTPIDYISGDLVGTFRWTRKEEYVFMHQEYITGQDVTNDLNSW